MRILVVIANYGSRNDQYLERVLAEYRSMPYQIKIVILSNIQKDFGPDIEVKVGLPTANPYSLPFGHRQVFSGRINEYDIFIYSEDDMLITAGNIETFLKQSAMLPSDEIPGFLRFEKGPNGQISYCDIHAGYCWDAESVRSYGDLTFAFLSNEHAACYLLTRDQLQVAINSGGFLVRPHEGKYDMREAAATDPYTQCGFRKMICISQLRASSVHHLPNNYVGRYGIDESDVHAQVNALLQIERTGGSYAPLVQMQTGLIGIRYLRDHYAPARSDILSLLDKGVESVLSFGCGETEIALTRNGIRVVAVPVDPVVSAPSSKKGVELVIGDLESVTSQLRGQTFDCLLFIDVLHLVEEPVKLIKTFMSYLKRDGLIYAVVPYIFGLRFLWGWVTRNEDWKAFREAGVRITHPGLVRKWFKEAGANPESLIYIPSNEGILSRMPQPRFLDPIVAKEFILRARRTANADLR